MQMETVELLFSGPLAWLPGGEFPCLSDATVGRAPGVYLWTVPTPRGEMVYYVGETARTFARRMEEHLSEQLSGRYRLYEPSAFFRGEKNLLWRGVYGPGSEQSVWGFVRQLPALAPALVEVVRAMRFHVAPIACEHRIRRRIEAAIAQHLRRREGAVGAFQDDDVRYAPRCPDEAPIAVRLRWESPPLGAPDSLEA
jgi:hypothetical protein